MEVALPSSATEPVIHRLVDDILAYIFLLNASLPDPEHHATTVASSQVCTRWRCIALNCRTIWGRIIDYHRHSLKWIETLLDRSNPTSLDFGSRIKIVYLADLADGGQGVLELVFNHIDRLRIFNLQIRVSSWELVCSRFLQLPAPNLEFVHGQRYLSSHPSPCVGHAVCRWAISRECYIGQSLDRASSLRSEVLRLWCSFGGWPTTTVGCDTSGACSWQREWPFPSLIRDGRRG